MLNLEVHYSLKRLKKTPEFARNPKKAFAVLGEACQEAVVIAYNEVNKPAKAVSPDNAVAVRFIKVGKYDVGVPDIRFVIKCGCDANYIREQTQFCDLFEMVVCSYLWAEGFDMAFDLRSLAVVYEIHCLS